MDRTGKKIRMFTPEWDEIRSNDNHISLEQCGDKPDVLLDSALNDIRQHDFGTWVLNQIYRFQCGMKVDPDTMAAEAFAWEFYGDICRIIYVFNEDIYFEIPLEDFASAVRCIRSVGYYCKEGVEITFLD